MAGGGIALPHKGQGGCINYNLGKKNPPIKDILLLLCLYFKGCNQGFSQDLLHTLERCRAGLLSG